MAYGLGEAPAREVDLEDAMMSPEEKKQQEEEKQKKEEKQEEGYGRIYMKTHEKGGGRSLSVMFSECFRFCAHV